MNPPPSQNSQTPAINTNVRLFDLVRFMRSELHQAELITDEEYNWITAEAPMANDPKVKGSPSPRRLEDYHELRSQLAKLSAERDEAKESAVYREGESERERNERQKDVGMQEYRGNTVSYIYDKAKCYGDMVHGCSPALAAAGFPVDENNPEGRVKAIAVAVGKLADSRRAALAMVETMRLSLTAIVNNHEFCADEKPNSFCSKVCADLARSALTQEAPTDKALSQVPPTANKGEG